MMRLVARLRLLFSCLSSLSVVPVAPTAAAEAILSFVFLDEVRCLLMVLRTPLATLRPAADGAPRSSLLARAWAARSEKKGAAAPSRLPICYYI